jgi:hypothetical protein
MTSRPDELDPDIKSRAPIQVPIFDMEGEDRKMFVTELFRRKGITCTQQEIEYVVMQTMYYSARDYRNFSAEIMAQQRKAPERTVTQVLMGWQASKSIKRQREFQEMIAALHCSYPHLLPKKYKDIPDEVLLGKVEELKRLLSH